MKTGKPAILMVTYSDPDIYSPIINSARLLAQNNYEVHILGYYRGRENTVDYGDGIELIRGNELPGHWPDTIKGKIAGLYGLRKKVSGLIKSNNYSLVIGHDATGFWVAAKSCIPLNIPIIYHCHDFSHPDNLLSSVTTTSGLIAISSSKLARHADAVIFPERSRAAWASLTWKLSVPVLVVPNAPLKRPLVKSDTLRQMFIKKGFSPERIIVRKGSISLKHGLEETVKAMVQCPKWGLALTGFGDIESVKALTRKTGVEGRVIFTGFIPYDSTWEIISSADVGLSIYQPVNINSMMLATASQKVFEYMACGIPSIAYRNPDFVDLSRQTKAISIIDSISPGAIADGLKRLLENDSVYAGFCSHSYKAHNDYYNYESLYSPVIEIIDGICKKSRK